jgi:hypothetical protein
MRQKNLTMLTDLYQLTMAYGYWKNERSEQECVFHLFYRRAPFGGAYAIYSGSAGVPPALFISPIKVRSPRFSVLNPGTAGGSPASFNGALNINSRDLV